MRLLRAGALSVFCAVPLGAFLGASGDATGYAGAHVARFDGVDANGLDLVWRAWIGDASAGDSAELRLVLSPLGNPADAARPTPWAVEGVLFVAGAPDRSFAADVEGTLDWKGHHVDLHGVVSIGAREGERVTYTAVVDEFHLRGDLQREASRAAQWAIARASRSDR